MGGTRTGAAKFHQLTTTFFRNLGFYPSRADQDLLIKHCSDGHHEHIARCVDDVMIFSKKPMEIMKKLQDAFTMKGVGEPQHYLGGDVNKLDSQWQQEGLTEAFSAETYPNPKLQR